MKGELDDTFPITAVERLKLHTSCCCQGEIVWNRWSSWSSFDLHASVSSSNSLNLSCHKQLSYRTTRSAILQSSSDSFLLV